MMACPIVTALVAGIAIDKKLGTTPWAIFVLTLLGMAFSTYAVYRVAMRTQIQSKNHHKGE